MTEALPGPVPIQNEPFNAETPIRLLDRAATPVAQFYVRNHFPVPGLSAGSWRLAIDGAVAHPRAVSLEELRALPERTLSLTLECAGNGRSSLAPPPPGVRWGYGAVGSARFTGTPLRQVLDAAAPAADVVEILCSGADAGTVDGGRHTAYLRSLPLEVARHPDTLLVWAMEGEPLTPNHGAPVRLVVPGWYGMASVKWLVGLSARQRPFKGHFQTEHYTTQGEAGVPDGTPLSRMRVRSIIASPLDGAVLPGGTVEIAGTAWSGAGEISRVETSADGGRDWIPAALSPPSSPYLATPWRCTWLPPRPGAYTLMARAHDGAGRVQPLEPVWSRLGYGNNAVQPVRVTVR